LRLARRLTRGNEDAAQDLVQDTLIRGLESFLRGDYKDQKNLRAYLMRILTNRFLSQRRRDKWDGSADIDVLATEETLVSPWHQGETTEQSVLGRVLDEPLERALAHLPDGLRATVLLVDIEGLEYREAAQILGIPVGTVRSRLFRARQLMHQFLLPCAAAHGWVTVSEAT
jgi:RNA polymerase sigma-70 factor, ECF subfamily